MDATITLNELFSFVLYLLGIGLLVYLIMLVRNINKIVAKSNQVLDNHEEEIENIIKEMPAIMTNANNITENVSHITHETKELVENISPEIDDILHNANSITGKVESTSQKVLGSIDSVTESVTDAAFAIEDNIRNVSDYVHLVLEIIDIIKNALKRKE